ncbi:uncharacterized protein F4807DRAFT_390869 [Annulohypoxylon truncatum]|uniref:uncharacterized protein n=1 Tax=Annulohypoxylon truncatum TaxID=327061 RepID=UPI002007E8F5|nr:uncharacterized protein F4807DRAFT_390869 [Annulohypoxylon truncatum]KAI1211483.1 hypothetical protein F4807DRAFT_390869 [Annulohypoxylon truncatum]
MPAVNLPLQETHGNNTLYAVPGTQLRLLSGVALTFLALVFLGVVLRVLKRRYKAPLPAYTGKLNASPTSLQTLWISEKSRGTVFYNDIMSVNSPSGISQLRAAENLGDGNKKRERDGSRERATGEETIEEERTASMSLDAGMPLYLKSGPPPPLPLTPPVLSTGVFTFQDRRLSVTASSIGDLDTSFFHQPNPDYTLSPSPGSMSTALPHDQGSPSIPRRRSYTKVLPLGPAHSNPEHGEASFPPSSFPSSSPILPLAPHESLDSDHKEIDVKGEIISVMDDSGAGWKRHTRVYGGGVCLACLASGSQGGFYGDNVPPEHRR